MKQILELRARVRAIYQKYQMIIQPIAKFVVAFVVFTMINKSLGYYELLNKGSVVFLLSLLCAFVPSSILVLLAMLVTLLHVYKAAMLLAALLVLAFFILYCLFLRYTPRYGYVVLAIPILYTLKVPYLIPILLGVTATPITIVPVSCGVVVYYIIKLLKKQIEVAAQVEGFDNILPLYTAVIDEFIQNKQMYMTLIVFALVLIVVYLLRKSKIDYAYEISVGAGSVSCIIAFLIVDLRLQISNQIGSMIFGSIISGLLVIVILFFIRVLDYTAVEHVQFEDDDYYYYVKAVPKLKVSVPNMKVKRINAQHPTDEVDDEQEEDEADAYEDEADEKEQFRRQREIERRILERNTKEAMTHDNL